MTFPDLINIENVISYARAAIHVARTARRLLAAGHSGIVVPSRGAVPFVNGAKNYCIMLSSFVPKQGTMPFSSFPHNNLVRSSLMPFTADTGPIGDSLSPADIRKFWVRVVGAIARQQFSDPNYCLYRFFRDELCKIGNHANIERWLRNDRFIFIDTVISGQAVVEISTAFSDEGFADVHYILLLDEEGRRMKEEFKKHIFELRDRGQATLIPVRSLFTEDQGPAISGIWSVVFPDVMEALKSSRYFQDGIVGGGLYYAEVRRRKDESNIRFTAGIGSLETLLSSAMWTVATQDEIYNDLKIMGFDNIENIERLCKISENDFGGISLIIERYLEDVNNGSLFKKEITKQIATPVLVDGCKNYIQDISVSSSHCLRIKTSSDTTTSFVKNFESLMKSIQQA